MTTEEIIDQIETDAKLYARAGFKKVTYYAMNRGPSPSVFTNDSGNERFLITIKNTAADPAVPEAKLPGLSERIEHCKGLGLLQD